MLLPEALAVAETELMGGSALLWPLTKVLDIGGEERRGRYSKASATVDGIYGQPRISFIIIRGTKSLGSVTLIMCGAH